MFWRSVLINYEIVVNRQQCFACGMAPRLCSEVFTRGGDNGKTRITPQYSIQTSLDTSKGIIPEVHYDCAKQAAEACPYGAITITKIESKE
jgi:ferredoxin